MANSATRTDAVNAGYVKGRTEGYAYASSQPGTVALQLYWSSVRGDNMTTLAGGPGEQAAIAAGYKFVRTEAYVFTNKLPYAVNWTYYSSTLNDNLLTTQGIDSTIPKEAIDALTAGYTKVGPDGVTLRYGVPGTRAVHQWWNDSRGDYFGTATDAGDTSAKNAGYVAASGFHGYVFTSSSTGTTPLKLYWHASRGDNFTTAEWGGNATSAGYVTGRTEGYIYSFDP